MLFDFHVMETKYLNEWIWENRAFWCSRLGSFTVSSFLSQGRIWGWRLLEGGKVCYPLPPPPRRNSREEIPPSPTYFFHGGKFPFPWIIETFLNLPEKSVFNHKNSHFPSYYNCSWLILALYTFHLQIVSWTLDIHEIANPTPNSSFHSCMGEGE